jgi:5-methylcytosine-specific restriction endonuclease McrA
MEYFSFDISEEDMKRERAKARELRDSQWWKQKRSKGLCHYCGESFKPKTLTMDHLVPIVRGGKSSKGNLVPACKQCNSKKKHMLPIEWEDYLERMRREDE